MDEYINKAEFRKKLLVGAEYLDEDTMMTVINILDCFPAADVCKNCERIDYNYDEIRPFFKLE